MNLDLKISNQNLIKDFGQMESWSKGTSTAPDGFVASGTAGSLARESTNIKSGTYSLKIISAATNSYKSQYTYKDYASLAGRTIRLGCWIKCSSANKARIYINDGVTSVANSSYHSGGGDWEFLEVQLSVDAANTQLLVGAEVQNNAVTAYFDGMVLVEGDFIFVSFREGNVYVREQDWQPKITFSLGTFSFVRKEGISIQSVKLRQRVLRLSVQIHDPDISVSRTLFDRITKASANGLKDLYFYDDRVITARLSNLPKLVYLVDARVYKFDLEFTTEQPFESYISALRTKTNITTSPVTFQVVSNGTYPTLPNIYFLPAVGITLASPITLENLTTGERLTYSNTVPSGGTLYIGCQDLIVLRNEVDGASYFSGDFLSLKPGTNNLKFTGTTGLTVYVDEVSKFI